MSNFLSKEDRLKSRVLMAKANIPSARVGVLYVRQFPDTDVSELRRVLNLRGTNEIITKRLEFLAALYPAPR